MVRAATPLPRVFLSIPQARRRAETSSVAEIQRKEGQQVTTTIYGLDGSNLAKTTPEFLDAIAEKPKKLRLVPEAGRVIVARKAASPYQLNKDGSIARGMDDKPFLRTQQEIDDEDALNTEAMILAVGDPDPQNGYVGTWREGQMVVIEPSVFVEVPNTELNGESLWLGSFYGIKARWEEVAEDAL